jgi:hypothetical protein
VNKTFSFAKLWDWHIRWWAKYAGLVTELIMQLHNLKEEHSYAASISSEKEQRLHLQYDDITMLCKRASTQKAGQTSWIVWLPLLKITEMKKQRGKKKLFHLSFSTLCAPSWCKSIVWIINKNYQWKKD